MFPNSISNFLEQISNLSHSTIVLYFFSSPPHPLPTKRDVHRKECSLNLCPVLQMGASLIAQLEKNLPAMQETLIRFLGWEDLLEKG